jgi:hypothetical protein
MQVVVIAGVVIHGIVIGDKGDIDTFFQHPGTKEFSSVSKHAVYRERETGLACGVAVTRKYDRIDGQ